MIIIYSITKGVSTEKHIYFYLSSFFLLILLFCTLYHQRWQLFSVCHPIRRADVPKDTQAIQVLVVSSNSHLCPPLGRDGSYTGLSIGRIIRVPFLNCLILAQAVETYSFSVSQPYPTLLFLIAAMIVEPTPM